VLAFPLGGVPVAVEIAKACRRRSIWCLTVSIRPRSSIVIMAMMADSRQRAYGAAAQGHCRDSTSSRCDLIVMASHGHRPVSRFMLGGVTQKVLAESDIPVLVYRS
jgi:nucleotide-binding universal stress UspA family protein